VLRSSGKERRGGLDDGQGKKKKHVSESRTVFRNYRIGTPESVWGNRIVKAWKVAGDRGVEGNIRTFGDREITARLRNLKDEFNCSYCSPNIRKAVE
jgi:hypothetical protein